MRLGIFMQIAYFLIMFAIRQQPWASTWEQLLLSLHSLLNTFSKDENAGNKGSEKKVCSHKIFIDLIGFVKTALRAEWIDCWRRGCWKEPTTHFEVVLWGRGDFTYQSPVLVKRDSRDQDKVEYRDVIRRVGWSCWVKVFPFKIFYWIKSPIQVVLLFYIWSPKPDISWLIFKGLLFGFNFHYR